MSRSLNKVMLIGNVGMDPEIRATSSGTRVAKVTLATSSSWTNQSGEKVEKTEWHNLKFFGAVVGIVEQYVKKGRQLYVEGRVEYSKYESDSGTKYWTEIVVSEMVMLGSSGAGGSDFGGTSGGDFAGGRPTATGPAPDDDLPF